MDFSVQDNWSDAPEYYGRRLTWEKLQGAVDRFVFQTRVGSQLWKIRLNDFPDDPLYTLVVEGQEVINFNEWPREWQK